MEGNVFSQFVNRLIPFEIITISELLKRCRKRNYDLANTNRVKSNVLLIITKGKGSHYVDFNKIELSPGTIVPLTKGQVHAFSKRNTVEGFVISFEESFITKKISQQNLFHFLHLFQSSITDIEEQNINSQMPYIQLLMKLQEESGKYSKGDLIRSTLTTFLITLKRATHLPNELSEKERFRCFLQFQILISKDYTRSHNVKYYADKLSVTYKYLNEISREFADNTAKDFIDNWLILEIKRTVIDGVKTSKEMAYKMGFKEPANFIRFFKRFEKMTPFQFKSMLEDKK